MAGKGGKGLLAGKTTAAAVANKEKEKRRPISRSSRAGLQLFWLTQEIGYLLESIIILEFGLSIRRLEDRIGHT